MRPPQPLSQSPAGKTHALQQEVAAISRKVKSGWFIRLNEFLVTCREALAKDGPDALVLHSHTRKQEPASGRIEIAPNVWSHVLGRNAEYDCLMCECRAQDVIDAHADGRLYHRDPPRGTIGHAQCSRRRTPK